MYIYKIQNISILTIFIVFHCSFIFSQDFDTYERIYSLTIHRVSIQHVFFYVFGDDFDLQRLCKSYYIHSVWQCFVFASTKKAFLKMGASHSSDTYRPGTDGTLIPNTWETEADGVCEFETIL